MNCVHGYSVITGVLVRSRKWSQPGESEVGRWRTIDLEKGMKAKARGKQSVPGSCKDKETVSCPKLPETKTVTPLLWVLTQGESCWTFVLRSVLL